MTQQKTCPSCGQTIRPTWKVSLVMCRCKHGGKAWHENVIGRCTYDKCPCVNLTPIEACIYPVGDLDNFKIISGQDFINLYKECNGSLTFV